MIPVCHNYNLTTIIKMTNNKNYLSKTKTKALNIRVTNSNNGIITQAIHLMKGKKNMTSNLK